MTRERPILFSSAMVRAILDGRKTQTRRLVSTREPLQFLGGRGEETDPDNWGWFFDGPDHHGYMVLGRGHDERFDHGRTSIRCPYGAPGDRLWVRETWWRGAWSEEHFYNDHDGNSRSTVSWHWASEEADRDGIAYVADGDAPNDRCEHWKKVPSIFMPRWASRITLEITEVRVQQLQAIRWTDIRAEGVECPEHDFAGGFCCSECPALRDAFAALWDSINGSRAPWSSNSWVWCLTFRRLT